MVLLRPLKLLQMLDKPLGTILENRIFQKNNYNKNVDNKSCSPKPIFFVKREHVMLQKLAKKSIIFLKIKQVTKFGPVKYLSYSSGLAISTFENIHVISNSFFPTM